MDTVATSQQLERICKHYFYANLFTIDSLVPACNARLGMIARTRNINVLTYWVVRTINPLELVIIFWCWSDSGYGLRIIFPLSLALRDRQFYDISQLWRALCNFFVVVYDVGPVIGKMSFNVIKCKVMHVGKRNQSFDYVMEGQTLEKSSSEKDLGVYLSCDLKSASHCIAKPAWKEIKCLALSNELLSPGTHKCYLLIIRALSDRILNTVVLHGTHIMWRTNSCWRKYNIVSPVSFQICES